MKPEKNRLKFGLAASAVLAVGVSIACSPNQGQAAPAKSFLTAMIGAAKPGQVIKLPGGNLGDLTLSKRTFSPAVTVYVGNATISQITLNNVTGLHIIGGRIVGLGGKTNAVMINQSKDIIIRSMDISNAHRGVVMNLSDGVTIEGNNLHDLNTDGIDVALSWNVAVRGNSCSNFHPKPAVYSQAGKLITDGDHADCIQGWSRPSAPATANVVVEGNQMYGNMQGIFFGNHVRGGVDDGGFDNIVIRNNRVNISTYNGIIVNNGRNSVIRDNVVDTIPGSRNPARPDQIVKANLRIDGPGSRACGNKVSAIKNHPGAVRC